MVGKQVLLVLALISTALAAPWRCCNQCNGATVCYAEPTQPLICPPSISVGRPCPPCSCPTTIFTPMVCPSPCCPSPPPPCYEPAPCPCSCPPPPPPPCPCNPCLLY